VKTFTLVLLIALLATCATAQVAPEEASAVLAGPTITDGELAVSVGYSKELLGMHAVVMGQFGETVEAQGELVKLFKLANRLYFGPVAGGGVDWSDEAGTGGSPTTAYVFGAAGGAVTYGFTNKLGLWAFGKQHMVDEIKPKFIGGIGFYYRL
jgi:hypothetical protein